MARRVFPLLALLAALSPVASAEPPTSAHVDIVNPHCPAPCYVASLGQLVTRDNPSIAAYDIVACSGFGTSASWGRGGTSYPYLAGAPRAYSNGPQVDISRLCGFDYHVCYGKGGACGPGLFKAANSVTVFRSEEEAVNTLKTVIASGTPVQIHRDMWYTWDDIAKVYPVGPNKFHGSDFIVVNGYDENYVYFTGFGPLGEHGETAVDMPILWNSFLASWRETPKLTNDRNLLFGPYFMCYLTSNPAKADSRWVTAWLGLDARRGAPGATVGPDAIRAAAAAVGNGTSVDQALSTFALTVMQANRAWMAPFFNHSGRPDLKALYSQSAALWWAILESTDAANVPSTLDEIADIEDQAIDLMAQTSSDVRHLQTLTPINGTNLSTLDQVGFHWLCLPDVKGVSLQLAMTGDFSNRKACRTFKPKNGNWFVGMGARDWLKVLAKDGGDRQLAWRVLGTQGGVRIESTPSLVTWDAQVITAEAPADGYSFPATELVRFVWHAPAIALRPRVAISATGDFADKKHIVRLVPARGLSEASFRAGTLAKLRAIDDGDGTVYWRVEDASARLTTVQPSPARQLILP